MNGYEQWYAMTQSVEDHKSKGTDPHSPTFHPGRAASFDCSTESSVSEEEIGSRADEMNLEKEACKPLVVDGSGLANRSDVLCVSYLDFCSLV